MKKVLTVKKKIILICVVVGLILMAALIIGLLSISNLSELFTHSDDMIVQIFEETDQGTVEKLRVDLQPDTQAYRDIEIQIKANTYFVSPFQVSGEPRFGSNRTLIYVQIASTDLTHTQLLIVSDDGKILVSDKQGNFRQANVLSGSSATELYKALTEIVQ